MHQPLFKFSKGGLELGAHDLDLALVPDDGVSVKVWTKTCPSFGEEPWNSG